MFKKIFTILFLLAPLVVSADDNWQDHPLVPRIPGYKIQEYYVHDYDAFDDKLARRGQPDLPFHAEGKVTFIRYYRYDKEIEPNEVVANYVTALKNIGATEINQTDSVFSSRVLKLPRANGDIYVAVKPEGNHAHYYSLTFIEPGVRHQQGRLRRDVCQFRHQQVGDQARKRTRRRTDRRTTQGETRSQGFDRWPYRQCRFACRQQDPIARAGQSRHASRGQAGHQSFTPCRAWIWPGGADSGQSQRRRQGEKSARRIGETLGKADWLNLR
jgi:hypothetical protein